MTRKTATKVTFTEEDVRLLTRTAERWAQLNALSGVAHQSADWAKTGDLPRIADAIEAELKGQKKQKPTPTNMLPGLHPGDAGLLRIMVQIARDANDAAALRDLAKRVSARAGKKKVYKAAGGASVTLTPRTTTINFKSERRRPRK
jgi:hypothetical protein